MTRYMYDSTTAADIPVNTRIVAGYVDGIYRWSGADWGRFPNAIKVGVAVSPFTDAGQVLDVETGDATPQQAPHWVLMRRAAGVDPTVYVNRSNWAATRQAFQQQQVPEPHYWLASYDGVPEIPAGTVAKQYANAAITGGHFDLSAVADYWPGVDPYNPTASAPSEVRIPQEVPVHQSEKWAVFRLGYKAFEGRSVEQGNLTNDEIQHWAEQIQNDGSNADAILQAFIAAAKKDGGLITVTAGPQGPPGPPGPPAGPHTHSVTGTAS